MEVIALDFLDMPASAKKWGYKSLLVIVDQLTRMHNRPDEGQNCTHGGNDIVGTVVVVLPRPGVYNIGRGDAL